MEERDLGINLIIDGISYPLTIKASEEPYYRQAARLVNNTLSLYKELFTEEESVKVMTMAALDIAFNSIKGGNEGNPAEVMRKIDELTRLIDSTLKK
ncbi:MAG: cell division protein ZapA [Bacteroidaceae bacterium]|nr:cell division protein ZapA [Bacteroidaceae bacterium]